MIPINKLLELGFFEVLLVIMAVVFVVDYFSKFARYFVLACTMHTDSKGMKHLKHQEYNKFYTW